MNHKEAEAFLHYFGKAFPSESIYPNVKIIKELIDNEIYDFYEIKEKISIFNK